MGTLPPTTPAQREELSEYEDLSDVLRHGFINSDVRVGRVAVSLRSILPWDREILNRRVVAAGSERQFKVWLLASVTWMLDGHVLLSRPDVEIELYRTYSKLSTAHINKLFGAFLQIRARYYKAYEGLEAFGYESASRSLWIESKIAGISSAAFRGYSASLGLCEIQRSWTVYNHYEDQREEQEHDWGVAKLIASSNAPKGIEKLNSSDKGRREQEAQRRRTVQDRFYYTAMKVLDDSKVSDPQSPRITGSGTPEELEDEMRRWILGEQDEHDVIVENYKKHVSERIAEQLRIQEEQLIVAQKVAREADEDDGAVALVGFSLSAVRDRLQKEGYEPHTTKTHFQSKGREYLYRRYLEKAPTTGTLSVDDGGRIVTSTPPDEKAPEKIDLSGRKVEFGDGGE